MTVRSVVLALALAFAPALVGCLAAPTEPVDGASALAPGLVPRAEPLWANPQTTPHPMFNFPTLTHPPADGASVPAWWKPIPARVMPATIAGLEPVASTGADAGVESGAGIALFGSLAVVPGYSSPTRIVDVTDPTAPVVLSTLDDVSHRNADTIAFPDGRLVAVLSTGRAGLLHFWDLTDPSAPVYLANVTPTTGTHKVNVVPGTPIVYNANSRGGGAGDGNLGNGVGVTEIFDASDPAKPVHVQDFPNGYGCHHIYFWNDVAQEKYRAICAGHEMTQIWDVADPRNPVVIVSIPFQHGNPALPSTSVTPASFSHFSILNDDGTVLVVGDEMGGGAANACGANAGPASTPTGALWFYDVSDETNPVLRGWVSAPNPAASSAPDPGAGPFETAFGGGCTAHHGRLVPNAEGRDLLVMGWYAAGVVLVDFTDPAMPFIVDQWNDGTSTWEAWYYNGYVFTGDLARGLDVLAFR